MFNRDAQRIASAKRNPAKPAKIPQPSYHALTPPRETADRDLSSSTAMSY